jgi:hypothetical protein
MWSDPEEI